MSDEINLTSIFNKIIEEKKTMLSIIFAGFILSLIYSLSAEESYKATAHLIPPENKYTQTLNVFLEDGYRLSREEITPSTVFRSLMLNLQSRKYQRKYFFDNKLYSYFDEDNHDKSFEDNFYKKLSFNIESKITSRDFREQQFLSINLIHNDSSQAADWLNSYIDMASNLTSQNYVDGINVLIRNTKKTLESEVTSKKNIARQIKEDKIIQLEEALQIARDLNIIERERDVSAQQNVILADDESIQSKNPTYLYGTKALEAEIKALKRRTDDESFIIGLRQLQQKIKSLDSIQVNFNDVRSAQVDQRAVDPKIRHAPKRKLIVFLGTFLATFFAFAYFLLTYIFRRNKNILN